MPRKSLRDRNREAIAHDQDLKSNEARLAAEQQAAQEGQAEAPTPRPTVGRKAPKAALSETARLGIYLTPQEFDDAKAAYLADWSNGGMQDTFARWIAAAIEAYAARAPDQRATAQPRVRADEDRQHQVVRHPDRHRGPAARRDHCRSAGRPLAVG